MPINFAKLGQSNVVDQVEHPRELFAVLRKADPRYQYPRDVQAEVWDQWCTRRNERDLVIKMNTGGGKTVVGLLILKALLNSGVRPAVYVAPDPYLVRQVRAEARALGIETTDDARDPQFLQGRSILVANIYKLLNGRSVFGVGTQEIPIGAIVVDDAHACIASAEEQFAIKADATTDVYKRLLALFREDLRAQAPTTLLDVEEQDPTKSMLVPFWAWHAKLADVVKILHANRTTEALAFAWPLLEDVLSLSECVFGGGVVEITPHCLPIDVIPSFAGAQRRVFMTATLADDGVLVTDFDVAKGAAEKPITPSRANDVGDRLILVPQELNPEIDDAAVRDFASELAEKYNVVVIVPSHARAALWTPQADQVLAADKLASGVEQLRKGHVGLTVIVNKYDGIDLPDDACRVLVLDGLPDVRSLAERIEQAALQDSVEHTAAMMQRVEQGMGRGVRSNADRCVVLLTGRSLIRQIFAVGAIDRMTEATRAQYILSQDVAAEIRGGDISELRSVIDQVLEPDPNWVRASRGALVHIKYGEPRPVGAVALAQRVAFNAARRRDFRRAAEEYQRVANDTSLPKPLGGWLRLRLAMYTQFVDPLEAQRILSRGVEENSYLPTKPLAGLDYRRLGTTTRTQGAAAAEFLLKTYTSGNAMLVGIYGITDLLVFQPETASAFERALAQLAPYLGFRGQRPELEYGHGPDVLWSLGELRYLVIEAKNGATTTTIHKSDVNQLTGSIEWFRTQYDASCSAIPIMVHPSDAPERASSPHAEMRVMREKELAAIVTAVRQFAHALVGKWPLTAKVVSEQLAANELDSTRLVSRFTVGVRVGR